MSGLHVIIVIDYERVQKEAVGQESPLELQVSSEDATRQSSAQLAEHGASNSGVKIFVYHKGYPY